MIQLSKSQILLLISSYAASRFAFLVDATSVKMDYLPIGHARVDPILRDDCLSDHVHTFYGPQSGVDPRRTNSTDRLEIHSKLVGTNVAENTGNVEENKSLYWHPTVYKYDRTTKTYTRDVMAQTSAYYVWETGVATAFPNGFRMIGGFDINKSFANAECVNESPCDEGDCYTENTFFPVNKCEELEVSMRMPDCWDGVRIESPPEHTNHVTYSENSQFDSDCPPTHPIKLPQIQLFFRIMPYNGGWHTFSDLSSIYHADYVSGWDEVFLQNVLDNCDNEGGGAMPNFFCEDFLTFRDAPKCTNEATCDFSDPQLIEKVRAFQPPSLDVKGTIVAEETEVLVGALPSGTCNGSLVGNTSPTTSPIISPTTSPITSPTTSPVASPTPPPTENSRLNRLYPDCRAQDGDKSQCKSMKRCKWQKKDQTCQPKPCGAVKNQKFCGKLGCTWKDGRCERGCKNFRNAVACEFFKCSWNGDLKKCSKPL